MEFAGKTIWITGASSGIGEGLALAFARAGARLVLSGRRVEALAEVAGRCQASTLLLPFEATDLAILPQVVAEAEAKTGGIDILINNAGISQRSLALDTDFSVYRTIMEVDYFAPLRLTQLVLPAMVRRGSGAIVNNASVAGKVGSPLRTAYCGAKHALVGWSDALRAEIAQYGVSVHVVTPGFVATGIAAYTAFLSVGLVEMFPEHAFNPAIWAIPTVIGVAIIAGFLRRLRGSARVVSLR